MATHVAILQPRYLDLILQGSKTVESRLTRRRLPPYGQIQQGDWIFFKQSSGPYAAWAVAGEVCFYHHLTARGVAQLKAQWNPLVRGDDGYWQRKSDSRYATMITLQHVQAVKTGPQIPPSRGPAWFVIDDPGASPRLDMFDVTLTHGAIRNRYIRLSSQIHTRILSESGPPQAHQSINALGRVRANTELAPVGLDTTPITLVLPDGRRVDTLVLPRHMIRWRGWWPYFRHYQVVAGDVVRFIQVEGSCYRVVFTDRRDRSDHT